MATNAFNTSNAPLASVNDNGYPEYQLNEVSGTIENQNEVVRRSNDESEEDTVPKETCCTKYQSIISFCASLLFLSVTGTAGIIIICFTANTKSKTICEITFTRVTQKAIAYDSQPKHLAVGDFNRDGNMDVVIANSGADNIGVRLGYGNGSFSSQVTYSTNISSNPLWVAVGNFNNDTFIDIVVANYDSHNVGVFLGYGNGNFSSQLVTSLSTSSPVSLAVGDFDGDDRLDIAVANNGTFTVIILQGLGNGYFRLKDTYYMDYDSMPTSIVVAHFNNDKKLDIAVANYGTDSITIMLANDNGTFETNTYFTEPGSNPCSIATGNFDNNNITDLAVAGAGTNSILIFLGSVDGTFQDARVVFVSFDAVPQYVAVGYINRDLSLDIIVANIGTDDVTIFLGYGNGTFSIDAIHPMGDNTNPYALAVSDFDKDNSSDIIVVDNGINSITILRSYTTYLVDSQTTFTAGEDFSPDSLCVADFNNDKKLDLAACDTNNNSIVIFLGNGDGSFNIKQVLYSENEDSSFNLLTAGDFNNDKFVDIAIAFSASSDLYIFLGQGNGSFLSGYTGDIGADSIASSITTADLNNDTNLDIITANNQGQNLAVLLGYGNGTFAMVNNYATDSFVPIFVSVADFNKDFILDLAAASYDQSNVGLYFGNGDGTFQSPILIQTSSYYSTCLLFGDLNKDHNNDIVVTFPDSFNVGTFLGYGNGSFQEMHMLSADNESNPQTGALNDFNSDHILDIATLNPEIPSIDVFFGKGDGTFPTLNTFNVDDASDSNSIALGDFNNDTKIDIAVGNGGSNDISLILLEYKPDFLHTEDYYQGSRSHRTAVIAYDFNDDNLLDIITTNSESNTIKILFGSGNGNFTRSIIYSMKQYSSPQDFVLADVNKDNKIDVVVASSGIDCLTVFLGLGNATFKTPISFVTGPRSLPYSVSVGDFNNDGWIDVVTANKRANNVGVFLGFEYPTFSTKNINLLKRHSTPYYVVVGDFNNDKQWDFAVACRKKNTISVFLGYGNGTFSNEQSNSVADSSSPVSLAVDDFDNDNQSDIIVANARATSIYILLGNGNGSFAPYVTAASSSAPAVSIAVADFNSDRQKDFVVAYGKAAIIGVFLGYGNGSFAEEVTYLLPVGSFTAWVITGDLDNDHISDIAVVNLKGNSFGIFFGNGDGTFRNVTLYSTGQNTGPCSIALGDFNKDNWLDIVVANKNAKSVGVYFGFGNRSFRLQAEYATGIGSKLTSVTVKDFNNDGILDIAVSDWGGGKGNVGILYGLSKGRFLVPKTYATGSSSSPSSIATADFNNDGLLDFLVTNSNKNNIGVMLRNTTEPFGKQTTFSTGDKSLPHSTAVADFNKDGQLDIAVTNAGTNTVGILFGDGNGIFAQKLTYSTGISSVPQSITIGDINNDKNVDIVVANYNRGNIVIFRGDTNGTFILAQNYSTGTNSQPYSVILQDLNRDNSTDMIVLNNGVSSLLVFFNTGNGTFVIHKSYSLGYSYAPTSVDLGDFNGDTWLDIVIVSDGTDNIDVFLQTC